MKVKIKDCADLDYILIARTEGDYGRYHAVIRGKNYESEFPMPKGNGFLELNI